MMNNIMYKFQNRKVIKTSKGNVLNFLKLFVKHVMCYYLVSLLYLNGS